MFFNILITGLIGYACGLTSYAAAAESLPSSVLQDTYPGAPGPHLPRSRLDCDFEDEIEEFGRFSRCGKTNSLLSQPDPVSRIPLPRLFKPQGPEEWFTLERRLYSLRNLRN
jgi:hypothetical protein